MNLQSAQDRGLAFLQTRSNAIIRDNFVPANCLEKVVHTKKKVFIKRFIYPRVCHQRLSSKVPFQVEHEGHAPRGVSAGEPLADEVAIEPKMEFRIQGILHAEVEQEEEKSQKRCIGRRVSAIMNHENKDALSAELQSKHPKTSSKQK